MVILVHAAAGIVAAIGSLHFAWRSRDFRKFLAGAFFVSFGVLLHLYLADVSVPILSANIVATPESSGIRSAIHFVLFLLCLYFGFIKMPVRN